MDISYKDFNFVCHLCLAKNESSILCVLQENVKTLLNNLGVQFEENEFDDLPKKICRNCEKSIGNIFAFINQCKVSYTILRSVLLHEKKFKNEIEIYDDSFSDNYDDHKQEIQTKRKHLEGKNTVTKENFKNQAIRTDTKYLKARNAKIFCRKCNLLLKSRLGLNAHYKKSVQCRPLSFKLHKCEHCNKEFLCLRDKTEHENIHTGETPYKCQYCIKEFKFKTNLHKHMYRHKLILGLVEKKKNYTEKRVKLKLRCDKCEKIFGSRSGFQQHKLKHDGKSCLKRHEVKLDKNIKDYLCNYCAMSFYIKANLDAHLRVHTGERPYRCSHCDQQFKQKSVLDRHTLNHLDVRPKPFVCDVCQKSFTTKAHMEIHKRLHTGEKPYECQFCQKCFNYRTRWRIHLRMHTGESPFFCSVCNSSYHDKGSLKKHQIKKGHTSTENSKDFNKNLEHAENQVIKTGKLQV